MKCQDCKFFSPDDPEYGECRRSAPQRIGHDVGAWPRIGINNWCGEFLEIPPPGKRRLAESASRVECTKCDWSCNAHGFVRSDFDYHKCEDHQPTEESDS